MAIPYATTYLNGYYKSKREKLESDLSFFEHRFKEAMKSNMGRKEVEFTVEHCYLNIEEMALTISDTLDFYVMDRS